MDGLSALNNCCGDGSMNIGYAKSCKLFDCIRLYYESCQSEFTNLLGYALRLTPFYFSLLVLSRI
ncbi:Uncharacterised protein [Chlamydia abortus]|uniref:hypothetical protein n=1 Tax=Chlamydia abortus TaxID=83555 RepID=UPI000A27B50C|nr:hypothetical protein [Chlamydia abortus]SFZ99896.1 Uncharacterised protein [Chlamydia abortus]SGA00876.1 Uncharacterised protein [Chlamydia abortus]SGA09906.1 Uncharacterised protein [Chlamydia abortus]SGA16608.1 Uncharacterised protein [Chlamydia abortus]SGA23526.1 Uncharacterised protein [Chlamydia abortus]